MAENDAKTTGNRFAPGNKLGKTFSSTRQPAKNGRKPSKLKKYIKDNDVSISDVKLVIKNIILTKTKPELDELCKDETQLMLVRVLVKSFLSDFKSGSIYNLNSLLDRIYGEAEQNININSYDNLSHEEKIAKLKELNSEING
jgi:hypothetical protein